MDARTEEFIKQQRKAFSEIIEKDIPLRRAAYTVTAEQVKRIFVEGKNSSDGVIGQYDTDTPLYVNPNKAPRKSANKAKGIEGLLPTRGKTGKTHFKDGREHKTTFVNNYKDLRNRMGRRIDRVDLFYSGDLKSDFSNQKIPAEPTKINTHEYVTGLKRDHNVLKLEGHEDKFGEFSSLTQKEINLFRDVVKKEFQLVMINAGKSN